MKKPIKEIKNVTFTMDQDYRDLKMQYFKYLAIVLFIVILGVFLIAKDL